MEEATGNHFLGGIEDEIIGSFFYIRGKHILRLSICRSPRTGWNNREDLLLRFIAVFGIGNCAVENDEHYHGKMQRRFT